MLLGEESQSDALEMCLSESVAIDEASSQESQEETESQSLSGFLRSTRREVSGRE